MKSAFVVVPMMTLVGAFTLIFTTTITTARTTAFKLTPALTVTTKTARATTGLFSNSSFSTGMSSLSTSFGLRGGGGVGGDGGDENDNHNTAPSSPSPSTVLTRRHVEDAIQAVIATKSGNDYAGLLQTKFGLTLRLVNDSGWDVVDQIISTAIADVGAGIDNAKSHMRTPWYFAMTIHRNDSKGDNDLKTACGVVSFYVSYSSWNGRVMYLDQLVVVPQEDTVADDTEKEDIEQLIMHVLGQITTELQFARLTWRHKETPRWHTRSGAINPEIHDEVLTLYLDQSAIDAYVGNDGIAESKILGPFTSQTVKEKMQTVLKEMNKKEVIAASTGSDPSPSPSPQASPYFSFRLVTDPEMDLPTMTKLIQGLAENVLEPDAVELSSEEYTIDGLTSPDPLFYCVIVDQIEGLDDEDDGQVNDETESLGRRRQRRPCGYAFFYFGYEAGKGRFLYLEDLFFEPEFRGNGGGKKLMKVLSMICQTTQCSHLYWQALDWNTRGLKFYSSIGATILDGVKTSRYCDAALTAFANEEVSSFSTT